MDVRYRLTVAMAIIWVAFAAGAAGLAEESPSGQAGTSFGPLAAEHTRVGTIGQQDSRFTLKDEDGNIKAYLYGANSLQLNRYIGQLVSVRVRGSKSVGSGPPRLWVDSVSPAASAAQGGVGPGFRSHRKVWPTALAQYAEPVMESTTVVYGNEMNAICGPPEWFWIDAQYLRWWTRGMDIPPLVTTSPGGTLRDAAGVLGEPGTSILFGDQELFTQPRNGVRLRSGFWFDPAHLWGIDVDLFWLGDDAVSFLAGCDGSGSPILARPFFNVNPRNPFTLAYDPPAREDSQLVCFPGDLGGSVGVSASTRLYGGSIALRTSLACDPLGPDSATSFSHVDLLAGYRYMYLRDQLLITENLTTLGTPAPIAFDIFDSFDTRNEFHGLDLGMVWRAGFERWWFEFMLRTAIGRSHQVADIQGLTQITELGTTTNYAGGLLAQSSNIGSHARDRLALVPELGVTFGYQLGRNWHLTVGYSLIHWSAVARAGDQIDLDVNPDQLAPPIDPLSGAFRPAFVFEESSFWAQGLDVGIEGRW